MIKFTHKGPSLALGAGLFLFLFGALQATAQPSRLTALRPVFSTQQTGSLEQIGRGGARLGDHPVSWGLRTCPTSQITYVLEQPFATLDTWIGVARKDADSGRSVQFSDQTGTGKAPGGQAVIFTVYGDGNMLYRSEILHGTGARHIQVNLRGIRLLRLVVRDAGTGIDPNHSRNNAVVVWGNPQLYPAEKDEKRPGTPVYEVRGGPTVVRLDANGHIVSIGSGGTRTLPLEGHTRLTQCREVKLLRTEALPGGGRAFTHLEEDGQGHRCTVTDRFMGTDSSVRWTVLVRGEGQAWSTSILSSLHWPAGPASRFWTAWSSPTLFGQGYWNNRILKTQWQDPLQAMPFSASARWFGGNPLMSMPTSGDLFSVPIATITDPRDAYGFSVAESPRDTLLYLQLVTTPDGIVEWVRSHYRISADHTLRFHLDLVSHPGGWRAGLRWMRQRYAAFFEPSGPLADSISGEGAYSSYEGPLDTAKYKAMAFKFNWKASFDFPYMGMFMPPADRWQTFATPEEATRDPWAQSPYHGKPTSREELEAYSRQMRAEGFYVLNYYNVTEFGARIGDSSSVKKTLAPADAWKDCTTFLYTRIRDGILLDPSHHDYYRSWGQAVVMDPGAPHYQAFLLDQARRTLRYLPSSAGICIDRMDWLRFFNTRADDGVSWSNGAPARSLYLSWRDLMGKLGPLFHNQGKVIFGNPLVSMRLDMMRQLDGIYSEHNELGPGLNTSAFLGLDKPVTAWTWDSASLLPDPDMYFQRFLYLGVFPTAPLPYNNHTVRPGAFADSCYLAYGALFRCLEGRHWVLEPGALTVQGTRTRANLFRVPGAYVIPIVMADSGQRYARIVLDTAHLGKVSARQAAAFLPGIPRAEPVSPEKNSGRRLVFRVPLSHRCAILRIPIQ